MNKVLLVDPVYNPGNIPLNVSLGRIESRFWGSGLTLKVCDFVQSSCERQTLSYFQAKEQEFLDAVEEQVHDSDVVYITTGHGIELKPYPMFPRVKEIATRVKLANPKVRVIVGGALINFYVQTLKIEQALIKRDVIDELVIGEEIGAAYTIGQFVGIEPGLQDEALRWSSWDWSKYPDYISVLLKIGCPYKCSFCFEGKIFNKNNSNMPLEKFWRTIEYAKNHHGIKGIMVEDGILMSYSEFDDIVAGIGELNLVWAMYARVNEVIRNANKLSTLRTSGCKSMIIGVETFNDELLKITNKRITSAQTLEALSLAKQNDLSVQGCFILGFPNSQIAEVPSAIDNALSHNLSCYRWHIFQPDYCDLPSNLQGLGAPSPTDHLDLQINVPDSCLPEIINQSPKMIFLDEHFLIRAIPWLQDISVLKGIGYKDNLPFDEMFEVMRGRLSATSLPLNEDCMYDLLFK